MKQFLFSGQDILVPALAGLAHAERGLDPALHPGPDLGAAAALYADSCLGRRDFELDGERCSALMLDEATAVAAVEAPLDGLRLRRIAIREALAEFPAVSMRPALRGIALLRWLETARFCGACGSPLEDKDGGSEDAGGRSCTACGRVHFPRISPAVILLIRKGRQALLAHNARFRSGFFGLIAGFVEAGETLEEAAVREAHEEAGIEIGSLRYVKSQPWPFPDSLMVAFMADWVSGEATPDGVEIGELRWCLPSELPNIPPKGSVARYLLDEFAREG
jgi:NADH pyrophosphatase NudC (nudix superfamily)